VAAIIFDFDGTIADSLDYFIDFIAEEANLPQLKDEERVALQGLSLAAIARHLGHPWWRLPWLYYKGRRLMGPIMKNLEPFRGMPKVIKKLHAEGHELFIISSNTVPNMRTFLRKQGLRTSFLQIYGGVVVFGKAPALRQLLKEQNLKLEDSVYVGDELRDVQAAQSIGMRSIAVTWGFASKKHLADAKPTAIADTPGELMKILEEV
jgi:HAD superfamily hydrolase (TIGR01549 family)